MNVTHVNKTGLFLVAVLFCQAVQAKTVALWPIEYNQATGVWDGRCTIDAQNDLTYYNIASQDTAVSTWGVGWNLPPNPDTTPNPLCSPNNMTYVCATTNKQSFLANGSVGRYLAVNRSFTLEGFLRLKSLPKSGNWWVLAVEGNGSANRVLLTLRNNHGAYTSAKYPDAGTWYSWQIVSGGHSSNGADKTLASISESDFASLTNSWHHWALTYEYVAGGTCTFSFWLDGEKKGEFADTLKANFTMVDNRLELGGRSSSTAQTIDGSIDYVRISDQVLASSEFLNAGGVGTCVPASLKERIKLYWRLGRSASGALDGTPIIGAGHLTGSLLGSTENYNTTLFAEEDCAFTGNPPNPTVSLPYGNAGSFAARLNDVCSYGYVKNLGKLLTLTNDFTVEGWIKPQRRRSTCPQAIQHICGTRFDISGNVGWIFQMAARPTSTSLSLHVQDKNGNLFSSVDFGNLTGREHEWHHLALSYDADGGPNGRGFWTCYIDGEVSGTHENTRAVDPTTVYQDDFKLFEMASADMNMHGNLDCWRVCGTVLAADHLMCKEGGSAATDVLALWPMNVTGGVYMDGRDVAGSYSLEATPRTDTYRAVITDDTPPQVGIPADSGSAGFRGFGGNRACLVTRDADAFRTLRSATQQGFTFETWLKLAVDTPSAWNLIVALADVPNSMGTNPGFNVNFTYRTNGFVLWANGLKDVAFTDEQGQNTMLEKGVWTHVALCYRDNGSTSNHVWELYLNGTKRSSLMGNTTRPNGNTVYIGGRPNSANSFEGKMACIRISSGILDPSEFLCNETETPHQTVAFWPIDYANGALDLENRLPTEWRFLASGTVAGSAEKACVTVPRPDASAAFIGNPKANVGSVTLESSTSLSAGSVASYVDVHAPFTAEGWIRWNKEAGNVKETICGTWNGTEGWRLMIDSTGASPAFRIEAKGGRVMTTMIDTAFASEAAAALDTGWHHLALTFDPVRAYGRGIWSLYVDGKFAGEAENWWAPSGVYLSDWSRDFRLGAATGNAGVVSMIGGYDLWRISTGVLSSKEFLFAPPSGTIILFQ